MACDVFGNGKTAVKVNVGKYEDPASNLNSNYSISNPIARIATTTTRTWTDDGTGNNNVPALQPHQRRPPTASAWPATQQTFGTATPITAAIDPNLLNGWGIRPNDWQIGASVQQQLVPRVSVEVGYFRRWLSNFTATDNRSCTPADFTPFSIAAPSDPRLPGGGGYAVNGLYNVVQAKFGQTANNITDAANFGTQYQSYNGMLVNFSARATQRPDLAGRRQHRQDGERLLRDRAQLPEMSIGILGAHASPTNP